MNTTTTISGTIAKIFDVQQVSDKFKKREIVIATGGDYPQMILCQTTQDNTSKLDEFFEGDAVIAEANIRGREWTNASGETKYFNTIEIWKIKNAENQ